MFCKKCGNKLKENTKFCNKCGNKIESNQKIKQDSKEKEIKNKDKLKVESKKEDKNENKIKVEPEKEKPKKINKKLIGLIISIFLTVIVIFILGITLINQNKPIKELWGEKYYVYLKDIKKNKKEAKIPDDVKKAKIGFIDVGRSNPIMTFNYTKNNDTYTNIYYLDKEEVKVLTYEKKAEIKFLYNIEKKEYNYYLYEENEDKDIYTKLDSDLKIDENIEIAKDDKTSVTLENDKELTLSKEDETFIEPDNKNNQFDFNIDKDTKSLKQNVSDKVDEFKDLEDIIDDVEKDVLKKEEKIEETKKQIEANSYKSGITNIGEALMYEAGFSLYNLNDKTLKVGDQVYFNYDIDKIDKDIIKVSDFKDEKILSLLTDYTFSVKKDSFDKTYSEDEIKDFLKELFGKNYTYDHKLYYSGPCSTLTYNDTKEAYANNGGGCGGASYGEPFHFTIISKIEEDSVTLKDIYIVPDSQTNEGPYQVYTDSSKSNKITSVDDAYDNSSLKKIVEENGIEYQINFDVDNDFYHFNNIKKLKNK